MHFVLHLWCYIFSTWNIYSIFCQQYHGPNNLSRKMYHFGRRTGRFSSNVGGRNWKHWEIPG